MSLLLVGALVFIAGRCGRCGAERAIFVDVGGRTMCAGCAAKVKP